MSAVPRMQTVQDEVQVLRHALGWLLEVTDDGTATLDPVRKGRAWLYAHEVFDATHPNAKADA